VRTLKIPKEIASFAFLLVGALLLAIGCSSAAPASAPASGAQPAAPANTAPPAANAAAGAQRDSILIGIPNPSTGPLAGFGEGSPWAENRALDAVNKDGGIMIKEANKKLPVKIKVVDTASDPTKAGEVASKLVLDDKVDMLLARHTPDTANPVSAMAERYQVPTVGVDAPVDAWLGGGPYQWVFHAFWTVDQISDLYIRMWEQQSTNKTVGYIFPNDPDGAAWVPVFNKKLEAKGYKVVDAGRFPYGTKDFTAMIDKYKQNNVDILMGTLPTPDFATAWRQMHQQGWVPKIATIGKAALFPADAASLGENLAQGLAVEVWWSPFSPFKSSITGETAQQLADAWTKENNKQWMATLGYKYASIEIAVDALKRAGTLDKTKIRDAIAATDLDTMIGHIKYNAQHYSQTPLLGAQWNKGTTYPWELYFIDNTEVPQVPKGGQILPLPK
jgi:branched-chain amino acid transport system substrate-binding protein